MPDYILNGLNLSNSDGIALDRLILAAMMNDRLAFLAIADLLQEYQHEQEESWKQSDITAHVTLGGSLILRRTVMGRVLLAVVGKYHPAVERHQAKYGS